MIGSSNKANPAENTVEWPNTKANYLKYGKFCSKSIKNKINIEIIASNFNLKPRISFYEDD